MRVALYARGSSEAQDTDLSPSAQLRALREYALRNGPNITEAFKEMASGRWTLPSWSDELN